MIYKLTFPIIVVYILASCGEQSVKNAVSPADTLDKVGAAATIRLQSIPVNAVFPFGCPNLISKRWLADTENYGQLKKPENQEFDKIYECFASINNVLSKSANLGVDEISVFKIGSESNSGLNFDTAAQQRIDSLKYRLPDIGCYQCYYFFESRKDSYGNLLLWNAVKRKGKILNIYYEVGGEQNIDFRYFYFVGQSIKIFEGSCYDDGCSLMEKYKVNIGAEGEIVINKIQ